MDGHILHHIFRRKNKLLRKEIDHIIYVVAFIGPIMTIPQIFKVWVEQNPSGVSLLTWSTYTITAFFWGVYGVVHKDKPLMLSSLLWILFDALIVIGILVYG